MPLREEKQVKLRTVVIGGLILLVVALGILWWRWDPLIDGICASRDDATGPAGDATGEAGDAAATPDAWAAALAASEAAWTDWVGSEPVWPADFAEPADCAEVEQELIARLRAAWTQTTRIPVGRNGRFVRS